MRGVVPAVVPKDMITPPRNPRHRMTAAWGLCFLTALLAVVWLAPQPPVPVLDAEPASLDSGPEASEAALAVREAVVPKILDVAPSPAVEPPGSDELPEEYRAFPSLGPLTPSQMKFSRSILRTLYQTRCASLDESLVSPPSGDIDQEVARTRLLRNVEVSLAAMEAFERGLYITIAADGPTPPLLDGVERIIMGPGGGRMQGQRANLVIVMPHSLFPALRSVKRYEDDVILEQRRVRIAAFNLLPIEERRAVMAKFRDREKLTDDEFTAISALMPGGTDWNEASAMLSERVR